MSKYNVDIGGNTLFGQILGYMYDKDIIGDKAWDAILEDSTEIVNSDSVMVPVEIIIGQCRSINFNDIMIALSKIIKDVKQDLVDKDKEIDKLVELKIQDKINNEYLDILTSIEEIHQLIHINKEKINHMYSKIEVENKNNNDTNNRSIWR